MAASQDLTAKIHTILRTTIAQYYVNQAVTRGSEQQKVQPGAVTFRRGHQFEGPLSLASIWSRIWSYQEKTNGISKVKGRG
jgi:hypothetical protein